MNPTAGDDFYQVIDFLAKFGFYGTLATALGAYLIYPFFKEPLKRYLTKRLINKIGAGDLPALGTWFSILPGYRAQIKVGSGLQFQRQSTRDRRNLFLYIEREQATPPFPFTFYYIKPEFQHGDFFDNVTLPPNGSQSKNAPLAFWAMLDRSTLTLFHHRDLFFTPDTFTIGLFNTDTSSLNEILAVKTHLNQISTEVKALLERLQDPALPSHFPERLMQEVPLKVRRLALKSWFDGNWQHLLGDRSLTPLEVSPTREWYWMALDIGLPITPKIAAFLLSDDLPHLTNYLPALLRRQVPAERTALLGLLLKQGTPLASLWEVVLEFRDPNLNEALIQHYRRFPNDPRLLRCLCYHDGTELVAFLIEVLSRGSRAAQEIVAQPLSEFGNHIALRTLDQKRPKLKPEAGDPLDLAYYRLKAKIGDLPHVGALSPAAAPAQTGALSPSETHNGVLTTTNPEHQS